MGTFELFCENKRNADLFWDCAKIFSEHRIEPVHFTIGMLEAWSELETNKDQRDFLIETLKVCDEEILMEQNPFASRYQQGYQQGTQRTPGSTGAYGLGRLAGSAAEKAGQFGGWLKNQWRDIKGSFMQGVDGGSHNPSAYVNGPQQSSQQQSGSLRPNQQPSSQDAQRAAQYFDQLMSMMKSAGMHQSYIDALKHMRSSYLNDGSRPNSNNAPVATAARQSGNEDLVPSELVQSRDAGNNAAKAAYQNMAGGVGSHEKMQSLERDVANIEQELSQAQAANDTASVARLQQDLDRYKRKLSGARGVVTKGGTNREKTAADSFYGMHPGAFQTKQ